MGEVWINGQYIGSFWENISQRTIPVPAAILAKGINRVVVFGLDLCGRQQQLLEAVYATGKPVVLVMVRRHTRQSGGIALTGRHVPAFHRKRPPEYSERLYLIPTPTYQ